MIKYKLGDQFLDVKEGLVYTICGFEDVSGFLSLINLRVTAVFTKSYVTEAFLMPPSVSELIRDGDWVVYECPKYMLKDRLK